MNKLFINGKGEITLVKEEIISVQLIFPPSLFFEDGIESNDRFQQKNSPHK